MLRREDPNNNTAPTIIGPSVKIEGDLNAVGNVLIEGIVTGTVRTDKDIIVGAKAKITANIQCINSVVAGEIHGNLKIAGHLEVKANGKIIGDIQTKTIAIESGATLNGKLNMGEGNTAVQASKN